MKINSKIAAMTLSALLLCVPAEQASAQTYRISDMVGGLFKGKKKNKKQEVQKVVEPATTTPKIKEELTPSEGFSQPEQNSIPAVDAGKCIKLVTWGDGPNKEEATKVALRSAVEQAYGTFVSANTTILNDDLVKDEIVTVSKGNIASFKELSSTVKADGKVNVTVEATVSITNLISYAQSKGAETEFAGATFAMNMKMQELNKQNEQKVFEHLLVQVKEMLPQCFDRKLSVEPMAATISDAWGIMGTARYNDTNVARERIEEFVKYTAEKKPSHTNKAKKLSQWILNADNCYLLKIDLKYIPNDNFKKCSDLVYNTLNGIALSKEEISERKKTNLSVTNCAFDWTGKRPEFEGTKYAGSIPILSFRNSEEYIINWLSAFKDLLVHEFSNFKLVDNMGNESSFDVYSSLKRNKEEGFQNSYLTLYNIPEGKGVFSPYVKLSKGSENKNNDMNVFFKQVKPDHHYSSIVESIVRESYDLEMWTLMPKSDISKYSNFKVERKN